VSTKEIITLPDWCIKFKIFIVWLLLVTPSLSAGNYPWLNDYDSSKTVRAMIKPPLDFERIPVKTGSFADWLRNLPLKGKDTPVLLYNGLEKSKQFVHHCIIDIDIGEKDLQQCADAVIRLRAEYLYSTGQYDKIAFNFTSGDRASFRKWIEGFRPIVQNNNVRWEKSELVDSSYSSFREYLEVVFTYSGSFSLSRELLPKSKKCEISGGEVFIKGGFPGHATIVIDVARDSTSGKRIFLIAQSFIPAQDIHILKNPLRLLMTPWYGCDFGEKLYTPEWVFNENELLRFED
jgi:hypothetical protein